jgi:hypothetical protein
LAIIVKDYCYKSIRALQPDGMNKCAKYFLQKSGKGRIEISVGLDVIDKKTRLT